MSEPTDGFGLANADNGRVNALTRRRLLQGAAATVALTAGSGLLAACGSDSSSSGTTAASGASGGTVGGTLNYLGWQGDDFPEVLAAWKKENNVQLKASYISALRDVQAKFAAGGAEDVDIIGGSSNGIPTMLENGVPLLPLDLEQIPNFDGMTTFFRENSNFQNADGDVIGIPYTWGAMGISFDSTKMSEPTAWSDLLEPEFKGQITIIDDANTAMGIAAPILGLKLEEATEEDLETIKAYMSEVLAQAKQTTPSFGDMSNLLASGEVVAAWGGYTSIDAFAAEAGNKDIKTAIGMEEGSASFAEFYGIPSSGENPATAYSMMNEILDPAVNAEAANTLIQAPCVDAAWAKLDKEVRPLFPKDQEAIEEFLQSAPLVLNAPTQSDEFVTVTDVEEAWIEIKGNA